MSGLILCGKMAKRPLYIPEADKNIYTIEELSYYLYNNAYMIGSEFFDERLIDFVEIELSMGNLGGKLRQLLSLKNVKTIDLITAVLTSNSYYHLEEIRDFIKSLSEFSDMTLSQRLKAKADGLLNSLKYGSALKTYMKIIQRAKEENLPDSFYGMIWNNMGVLYSRQFLYNESVNCFKMAHDLHPVIEIMDRMVAAAIMSEDEDLLNDIRLQYNISDSDMAEYRKVIDFERKHIASTREFGELVNDISYDMRVDMSTYYSKIREIIDNWKNTYREDVN